MIIPLLVESGDREAAHFIQEVLTEIDYQSQRAQPFPEPVLFPILEVAQPLSISRETLKELESCLFKFIVLSRFDFSVQAQLYQVGFDFVVDPSMRAAEVAAAVSSLLHAKLRKDSNSKRFLIDSHSVEINRLSNGCIVDGQFIALTKTEMKVFGLLLENLGRLVPKSDFLAATLNEELPESSFLRVHMFSLRKKLGELGDSIQAVRGRGYCLQPKRRVLKHSNLG